MPRNVGMSTYQTVTRCSASVALHCSRGKLSRLPRLTFSGEEAPTLAPACCFPLPLSGMH